MRTEVLSDVAPLCGFFFSGLLKVSKEEYLSLKVPEGDLKKILQFTAWKLDEQREWNKDNILADLKDLSSKMGITLKKFMLPLYLAVTGNKTSIPIALSMDVLGPDMARSRMRGAVEAMGSPTKKEAETLKEEYDALFSPSDATSGNAGGDINSPEAEACKSEADAKGAEIRELKANGADKDKIKAVVGELLALKAKYKTITGQDFPSAAPAPKKKKAAAPVAEAPQKEGLSKKEKNKLSKKAKKAGMTLEEYAEKEGIKL